MNMRLFPRDSVVGRSYTELQKKTSEKVAGYKQAAEGYKDTLEQYDKEFQKKLSELHQIMKNLEELQGQKEDLQFLKEKQEYVLKNFPTLESNVVEKIKGAQANHTREILDRLEVLEEKERKHNIVSKIMLTVSMICGLASTGGIVVILLYLMDYITF